ncbi:DsbE family thiol:disulfide interchange protein [Panacagrimonas sp.]|uniref:DsbE family thiol:disulfide interchange protein n=1 Tax=Panacagrimonas sp. TaxID=2480088 RepID=UPI003B51F348
MRYALPVALLLGLLVLLGIGLRQDPSMVPSPLIGKPVPEFALPLLDDDTVTLTPQTLAGRTVLVNFFASWCAGCQVEHPLLMKLAREQGVELVGLAYKDEPQATQQWLRRHGNPYRSVAKDRDGQVGLDWGVYGVPETYVLGADGTILYKQIGPMTVQAWQDSIAPLLQVRSAP